MHNAMHPITAPAPPPPLLSCAYSAMDLKILMIVIKNAPKARDPMFVTEAHLNPSIISPDPSALAFDEK